MADASESRLAHAWSVWCRFWFTPSDPTVLCLMRIVAGLLVFYVHIAFCFDLQAFFGPTGWYNRTLALRSMREYPNMAMPSSWDGFTGMYRFPPYLEVRQSLREFVTKLSDRQNVGERVLNLLSSLPPDPESRQPVWHYLQYGLMGNRDEKLSAMVEGQPGKDGERLPEFFQNQPRQGREALRDDIQRFFETLPSDPAARTQIFTMLSSYNPRDIQSLKKFVEKLFAETPEKRKEILDYIEHWGVMPDMPYVMGQPLYSPYFHTQTAFATAVVHGLHLLVIFLFTIGYQTRITSVLTWLAVLAFVNRNPLVLFGQDTMLNLSIFYLMISPCGQVWSVDAWLARKRGTYKGTTPLVSANLATRGLQVHYCFMYLSAGLSKLKGSSWWSGTAPWGTMTNPEFSPLFLEPYVKLLSWLCQPENRWLWEFYMSSIVIFTLTLEIAFPFLVWTRLRPIVVAAAIMLHVGIAIYMGLIVFSLFMLTLQLCFMTPTAVKRVFGSPPEASPNWSALS